MWMGSLLNKPLGRTLVGLVVVVVIVVGWFVLQFDPIVHTKGSASIVVTQGESLSEIGAALHAKGVLASPLAFSLDSKIFGSPKVLPGAYEFPKGSWFPNIRSILSSPPNVPSVDVTAGLTLKEVTGQVDDALGANFADTFYADTTPKRTVTPFSDGTSLEGLIGTGEYLLFPGETPSALANKMATRFVHQASSVGLTPTSRVNGLDAYQLVIAASIVEKEGYYPVNMPRVARVIYNRLARGGPLQMDATVLYYLGLDGGTVTPAMLQTQEPYNTYLNVGLTPTPICAISKFAMRAVLHAPTGSWLYFTLINKDGTMAFSTTFAQQLKNEKLAESRGIG
jgi:UPF0755 protein